VKSKKRQTRNTDLETQRGDPQLLRGYPPSAGLSVESHNEKAPTLPSPSSYYPSRYSFDELLEKSLPFSLRFKHSALKRGHQLLTVQETSYSILCRAFKYCIFSNTRDDIVKRLDYLFYESCTALFHSSVASDSKGTTPTLVYSSSPEGPNIPSLSKDGAREITEEITEDYMDPDGVESYLLERGLFIAPGSDIVPFPSSTSKHYSSLPTLFDEIRSQKELRLSVDKLLAGQ